MKKVKDIKYPTLKQMSSISDNLREKFGEYSSIQITTNSYTHTDTCIEYYLYIANTHNKYFDSWQELLTYYHKLMKGAS